MRKSDKEFNSNTAAEYSPLPDEFLQGGGRISGNKTVNKKHKRMIFMTAAVLVIAAAAMPFAKSEAVSEKTPPTQDISQPQQEDTLPPDEPQKLYPLGDGTVKYEIYNDSYYFTGEVIEGDGNKLIASGVLPETSFTETAGVEMPQYEPQQGYTFMGWVACYSTEETKNQTQLIGNTLTADTVELIVPVDGVRNVQIHAAWRRTEENSYPYTLTLNANGGEIDGGQSVSFDAAGPMMSGCCVYLCAYPVPTREGYVFTGWYSEQSGGNAVTRLYGTAFYEKNGDEPDWQTVKPITLYAGWEKA